MVIAFVGFVCGVVTAFVVVGIVVAAATAANRCE